MTAYSFTSFPELETERLHLRQLSLNDEKEIYFLRSDPEVNKYLDRPRASSLEEARQFIQKINEGVSARECPFWAIHLKQKAGLIGTICLWNFCHEEKRAELGYELLPQYQGKGYMTEAMQKVIGFGIKTMQLKTIEAWCRADNRASLKILEKNKFKRDKKAEARMNAEEQNQGLVIYSLHHPTG